jgi:hypothetical protein
MVLFSLFSVLSISVHDRVDCLFRIAASCRDERDTHTHTFTHTYARVVRRYLGCVDYALFISNAHREHTVRGSVRRNKLVEGTPVDSLEGVKITRQAAATMLQPCGICQSEAMCWCGNNARGQLWRSAVLGCLEWTAPACKTVSLCNSGGQNLSEQAQSLSQLFLPDDACPSGSTSQKPSRRRVSKWAMAGRLPRALNSGIPNRRNRRNHSAGRKMVAA